MTTMLKSCPDAIDISELQFKLQCRLKIFENKDISTFPNTNSLLTCASRYGLLFVGTNDNCFEVIQTTSLQTYSPKDKVISDYQRRNIQIPSAAKHLCVNCDSTILAVVIEKDFCPIVIFYDVLSFLSQNIKIIKEIRLSSTPNVYVREINWNPSMPAIFTSCKSDGSLGVYELKGDSIDINELPVAAGATCFCWSPKGKQIAVGSKDGKITQYKPDLKAVKAINEPTFNGPHTIISLQWVSNYQFIGVYQSVQDAASLIIVVDAPKTGEPTYTNYEDICYSGSSRLPQFYLILQQNWNFLMVASANSTEVGVLGNSGELWTQWIMPDTARAELPLSPDHQETLPVGLSFDISSTTPLPWGESSIPPCPLLCVLSHQGVLCCFNVVYLKEGMPSVCTPPDPVSNMTGLSSFVTNSATKKKVEDIVQPIPQQAVPKALQAPPMPTQLKFGMAALQPGGSPSRDSPFSFPKSTIPLNIQSQSTPLVTGKLNSNTTSNTLFGGQATLTPIKPQQPSQGMPLFGGQSLITPISKGPNGTNPSNPATGQSTNFSEKYSSLFSSVNPTSLPQSNTAPIKPIVISTGSVKPEATVKPREVVAANAPASIISKPQDIAPKIQMSLPKQLQRSVAVTNLNAQTIESNAETSAMLSQMIRDEWMYLETELKVLVNLGRAVKVSVGTDKEKVDMIEKIDSLQEFLKEAVDISGGQSSEIHCLKQNLIQSWACFEEAKSHYNSSKNETVALLIKLQPLDSLSQKRLKDIEQLIYYVESQLSQAGKTLDEQWDNFQDYAKKTHKVKMPTMEAIFQTMVRQNAILQKQTYVLKDISMRLRRKHSNMSSILLSLDKGRDLVDDFQGLDSKNILQIQYQKIKNYTKNLSDAKANKLRNLLNKREVTRVTAIKPQVSSWAINQSPASRIRQSISMLGSSMSPAVKASIARNLDFTQSPLPRSSGQDFSLKTPEKPMFSITPNSVSASSTFVPLVKSSPIISRSQGSAFTPIGSASTSVAASGSQPKVLFKSNVSSTASFSFGELTKTIPFGSQIATTFSNPTKVTSSFTTSVATTTSNKPTFGVGSEATSIFKAASDSQLLQPTPASNNFAFGSGAAAQKSVFGTTPCTASGLDFTSSSFQTTSSSAFGNSTNQSIKQTVLTPTVSTTLTKSVPPQPTLSASGQHQTILGADSQAAPTTTASVAPISGTTTKKPTSGVASIFANLQSVIDKATSSSTAVSSVDNSKPVLSFGSSVTSTTQSAFGSLPSNTSVAKTLFGSAPSSDTASFFGGIPKPALNLTSTQTEFRGTTSVVSSTTPASANIFGKATKNSEPSKTEFHLSSTGLPQPAETGITEDQGETSTPSNVITVSLFSSKPSETVEANSATTSAPAASITSIFGGAKNTTPALAQPGTHNFGSSTLASTTQDAVTSASPSIFGSLNTPPSSPIISTATSTATAKPPIFGSSAQTGSIFASAAPNNSTATTSATSNIFAASAASGATSVASAGTAGSGPIFGSDSTSSGGGIFMTTPTTSIFGSPTESKNMFASSASSTTSAAAFGTPVTTTTTSAFAAPIGTTNFGTSSSSNVFDTASAKTNIFASPASSSVFGAAPSSSSGNIFASPTTTSSVFGSAATTSSGNIFGSSAPVTTSSIFGSSTTSTATPFGTQSGTVFGASTTTGNVFGQTGSFGNQPTFGGANTTTSSSVFGQASTPTAVFRQTSAFGAGSENSVFGPATTVATTSGNIFGSTVSASSGFGSGFGTSTTNTFGSPATTQASTGGTFGFGGLSVASPSSSGSIFGGSTGGAFGTTAAASPFGKTEAKPGFGSTSSSIFGNATSTSATTNVFGSPASTTSSIFGSSSGTTFGTAAPGGGGGAFGSPSAFGSSTFGQKPAFGQPSAFGSSSFGSPQPGAFSGSSATPVAQTGFGSSPSFQKPSGFGTAPVFGGSPAPAFGSPPAFGAAASFGSAPTFGSPEKVFGSPQPASVGFAAAPQQSTGFGNLASQNTIGFGNLAQQQANTPASSMPFSGNTSFSSWR